MGQMDFHMEKKTNKIDSTHSTYKSQFQVDCRSKCERQIRKLLEYKQDTEVTTEEG